MKIAKTMEKMGNMPLDVELVPLAFVIIGIYIVISPIWLPICLGAKFYEFYQELK